MLRLGLAAVTAFSRPSIKPISIKTPLACLLSVLITLVPDVAVAGEMEWRKWPANPGPHDASIHYPSTFRIIPPLVDLQGFGRLNLRVRSPGGEVEFAVTARSARGLPNTVKDRAIPLPLAAGEKIVERQPVGRKVNGETGPYLVWDEAITVEGPNHSYTRYFRHELSTSNLPGAPSVLWEFKVTGEKARKAFQQTYRQFKKSHDLGEF